MKQLALISAFLFTMSMPLAAQVPSPYAGAMQHQIKSLSPAEIDDLRAGRGMGLAKPAELNGYPGPMHVLELATPLDLSADQRAQTQAIMTRMRAAAIELGARIIAAERDLDQAFATSMIDSNSLQTKTAEIAALHGALRAVHLTAHLDQRAVLSADQTHRYMLLRGYAGEQSHPHHRPHR